VRDCSERTLRNAYFGRLTVTLRAPSPPLFPIAMRRLLASLSVLGCLACGTDSGSSTNGGTVIIGALADADALLIPLVDGIQGRTVSELLFDRLAEMGPSLNTVGDVDFQPRLAKSWRWSGDSLSIVFSLHPDARWHDGRPVVARDVVFGFDVIRDSANASPLSAATTIVTSVSALDSLTVEMRFASRAPEQFVAATQIIPLPAHIYGAIASGALRTSEAARAPVGSGRFKFVRWEPGVRLELAAVDGHYRGRPKLDRVLFSITPELPTAMARLKAAETDVFDPVPPNEVADLATQPHLNVFNSPSFDYSFVAFNFRDPKAPARPHPLFAERALRRALTLAVDRTTIVKAIFDTLALSALGPVVRAQATADTTIVQIPFDRAAAEALLDSLGWTTRAADGTRMRNGRRLAFSVPFPSTSRTRERAATLIQEQLRSVGVSMTLVPMDFPTFIKTQTTGNFDAIVGGTRTTPSPTGLRGSWASAAIPGGGVQNAWHYESAAFDSAVQSGLSALDPVQSKAHLRRAYQQVVDDAAAIWLYEVRNVSAVHKRFVLPAWRPDAWWLTLGEWSVDPAQRLPRDAAPASPPAP
jgi:peptide/nickel transport system substrate-binding protein